jgi:hypothetical protein
MMKRVKSDFLFAQPSFVSGIAHTFDMWGQFDAYNESESGVEADGNAVAADWFVVGQDLLDSMEQHDSELRVA